MKKITLFLTALLVTMSVSAEFKLQTLWEYSQAKNNLPTWFSGIKDARSIAVSGDVLYIADKEASKLFAVDLNNPSAAAKEIKVLNGVAPWSITATEDGKLLAYPVKWGGAFLVYELTIKENQATPKQILNKSVTGCGRCDYVSAYGNFTEGIGYLYFSSNENTDIVRFKFENGVVSGEPEIVKSTIKSKSSSYVIPDADGNAIRMSNGSVPEFVNFTTKATTPFVNLSGQNKNGNATSMTAFNLLNKRIFVYGLGAFGGIEVIDYTAGADKAVNLNLKANELGVNDPEGVGSSPLSYRRISDSEVEIYSFAPKNGIAAYRLYEPYFEGSLYVVPGKWLGGARLAVYFFNDNGQNEWVDVKPIFASESFQVTVPEGTNYTKAILCRMNPDRTTKPENNGNNWDNRYNQSKDMLISELKDNNAFVIKDGDKWDDKNDCSFGVYNYVSPTLALVGDLPGLTFDEKNVNYKLVENENGLWTVRLNGVSLTANKEYGYKIVLNQSWNVTYPQNGNKILKSDKDILANITFTLDPNDAQNPSYVIEEVVTPATPVFGAVSGNYLNEVSVEFNAPAAGTVILYTTDGQAPTKESARYTAPIVVKPEAVGYKDININAQAFALDINGDVLMVNGQPLASEMVSASYSVYAKPATPVIVLPAGTYGNQITVEVKGLSERIVAKTGTWGSINTTPGQFEKHEVYKQPMTFTTEETHDQGGKKNVIKFAVQCFCADAEGNIIKTVSGDYICSGTAVAEYIILPDPKAPVFELIKEGNTPKVKITCPTEGVTIHYSLRLTSEEEAEPEQVYTDPFDFSSYPNPAKYTKFVIKAYADLNGVVSNTVEQIYQINADGNIGVDVENNQISTSSVYTSNSNIFVNAAEGSMVEVYTIQGQRVYAAEAVSETTVIEGINANFAIVRVNGENFKVILK